MREYSAPTRKTQEEPVLCKITVMIMCLQVGLGIPLVGNPSGKTVLLEGISPFACVFENEPIMSMILDASMSFVRRFLPPAGDTPVGICSATSPA